MPMELDPELLKQIAIDTEEGDRYSVADDLDDELAAEIAANSQEPEELDSELLAIINSKQPTDTVINPELQDSIKQIAVAAKSRAGSKPVAQAPKPPQPPISEPSDNSANEIAAMVKAEGGKYDQHTWSYDPKNPKAATAIGKGQWLRKRWPGIEKKLGIERDEWYPNYNQEFDANGKMRSVPDRTIPGDTPEEAKSKSAMQDRMLLDWWKTIKKEARAIQRDLKVTKYNLAELTMLVHFKGNSHARHILKGGADPTTKGNVPVFKHIATFSNNLKKLNKENPVKAEPESGIGLPGAKLAPQQEDNDLDPELLAAINSDKEPEGDTVKALITGAKGAFAPHTLTAEDYEGMDKSDIASSFAVNVAGGIATTAAATAAVAATAAATGVTLPVGAAVMIGSGLYGIYAGIGGEISRSEMEGQEFSWARAAAITATEVNSVVKGGKKLVLLLRTIAQAKTMREVEKSYGTEDEDALNIITGMGMLSMAGPIISRNKAVNPKEAGDILEALGDKSMGIHTKTAKAVEKADNTIDVEDLDFKTHLTGAKQGTSSKDIDDMFNKRWDKLDTELKQDAFDSFIWTREQAKVTTKEVQKAYDEGTITKDALVPLLNIVEDMKFTARRFDDSTGLDFEAVINEISNAESAITNRMTPAIVNMKKLRKEAKKLGIDGDDIGRYLDGSAEVPDKAANLVAKWRVLYENEYTKLKGSGHNLGHLENYFNMNLLDAPDLHLALKSELDFFKDLGRKYGNADGKDMIRTIGSGVKDAAESKALKKRWIELKRMSMSLTGSDPKTFNHINVAADKALNATSKRATGFELGVVFERENGLPEQFRKFDVYSGFLNYVSGNYKAIEMAKPLRKLENNIATLDKMGMKAGSKYWKDYLKHMSGQETGFKAFVDTKINTVRASLKKDLADPNSSIFTKMPKKTALFVADFGGWMSGTAYGNLLGANVRAPLRNLTQTLVETAPHLGYGYGSKVVKRGWASLIKREEGSISDFLKRKNIISGNEHLKDAQLDVASEIRKYNGIGKLTSYADKTSELLLTAYTKSDHINRYVTYKAGQQWAKDIIAGDKQALKALKRMGSGNKSRIVAGNMMKDEDALGDFLGKALVSDTQFQYGRSQMHALGRHGGRLVSMFTKWPSIKTSELIYHLGKDKNTMHMLMKLGGPYAFYHTAQKLRESSGEDQALLTYLAGKDLRSNAPASSVGIVNPFNAPVIDNAIEVAGAVANTIKNPEDGADHIWKVGANLLEVFNPIPAQAVVNEYSRWQKAHGEPTWKQRN